MNWWTDEQPELQSGKEGTVRQVRADRTSSGLKPEHLAFGVHFTSDRASGRMLGKPLPCCELVMEVMMETKSQWVELFVCSRMHGRCSDP